MGDELFRNFIANMLSCRYSILLIIFAGVLSPGLCKLHFLEEQLSVRSGECVESTLVCRDEKLSLKINLTSDFSRLATVIPSQIDSKCPGWWQVKVCSAVEAGSTVITAKDVHSKQHVAYLRITVFKIEWLRLLSYLCGWIYFAAWSISFYPQIYENYKRKSVVGLNFDFLALNIVGFTLYSFFNCGMYFIPEIQKEYMRLHPKAELPVFANDVFFSVHAVLISAFTISQCFMYERESQRVSLFAKLLLGVYGVIVVVAGILTLQHTVTWLQFLYYCSYIKLSITVIKYMPQAYMNYRRRSTVGWSIGNVLLDFTGGIFSMLQMIMNSYNYDDWISIFGDLTKFGLGLFSVLFDLFFMYQHYVLYRYVPASKTKLNISGQ